MLLAVWYAQQRRIARAATHRLELEQQVSDRTYELAQRNRELEDANRRLEMASLTDTLTGLANRRYLMQQFPRLIADRKANAGLAIMIIDLDALKPINDQHGHAAGDDVIVEIAKTLRQAIRPDDVLARWGGDEFVVVAHAQHVEHACMLAERMRERIAKMKCVLPRGAVVRTSCSIGLTCLPFVPGNPEAVSWEQAIKIADLALYRAKRGRNAWRGWFGTEHVATLQFGHLRGRIECRRPDRQRCHHRAHVDARQRRHGECAARTARGALEPLKQDEHGQRHCQIPSRPRAHRAPRRRHPFLRRRQRGARARTPAKKKSPAAPSTRCGPNPIATHVLQTVRRILKTRKTAQQRYQDGDLKLEMRFQVQGFDRVLVVCRDLGEGATANDSGLYPQGASAHAAASRRLRKIPAHGARHGRAARRHRGRRAHPHRRLRHLPARVRLGARQSPARIRRQGHRRKPARRPHQPAAHRARLRRRHRRRAHRHPFARRRGCGHRSAS